MTINQSIPAAQYLRMSTEHQQYSLENQSTAIQIYAKSHGFEVVRTYSDSAKSGLVLRRRTGLQQLLKDVVGGTSTYRVILSTAGSFLFVIKSNMLDSPNVQRSFPRGAIART
jgi:predicted site-specific integrase-resolvase